MATLGWLNIGVSVATEKLQSGLTTARGMLSGFTDSVFSVQGALVALGGAFVVDQVVDFFGDAARAASDLNEQLSKADQVFGPAAAKVKAEADDMARRFGIVKSEYLEGASAIGLLASASGVTGDAAADMGNSFAKLAIDASSFFNVPVADALGAIRSGLTGEAEPLKRFGVLLNEDAVKAEAARLGLARFGAELTEAQKVQARASLITQGLSKAQGDLARTATGAANQTRSLAGRMENLKATVGTGFQSVTESVLGGFNLALANVAGLVDDNADSIRAWAQSATREGGFIFNAIEMVGNGIALVADVLHTAGLGFRLIGAVATASFSGIVQIVATLAAAIEGLINLIPGVEVSFASTIQSLADSSHAAAEGQFADLNKAMMVEPPSTAIKGFFADIRTGAQAAATAAGGTKDAITQVSTASLKLSGDIAELKDKLKEQAATMGMSSSQAEIYKLRVQGASESELAEVSALADQVTALEKAEDVRKQMESDAKSLIESTQTPLEKFQVESQKLQALAAQGLIDPTTLGRGLQQARDELAGSAGDKKFGGALELGSSEARSAVLAFRAGSASDPIRDVARNTASQAEETRKATPILEAIRNGIVSLAGEAIASVLPG